MLLRAVFSKLQPLKNTEGLMCTCKGRFFSSEINQEKGEVQDSKKIGGYAEAYQKFEKLHEPSKEEPQTFANLLRNSKFIDVGGIFVLGDPHGKVVTGKIFHIVDDDLYIDFGWKFHCVCPRPQINASNYVRGAKVKLVIKELELSTKFLGYEKDLTLLEADCHLLGLIQERNR